SALLGALGIDLIADKIESEGPVVDLLDYDVRFGQGLLFSPPRPVRTDVIAGAEREPPRRETTVSAARGRPDPDGAPAVRPSEPASSAERPDRRAGMRAQLARGGVRRA